MFPPIKFKRVVTFTIILLTLLTAAFTARADIQDQPGSSPPRGANLGGDALLPNLKFTHLSLEEGLPHSDVRDIVQDGQGFMWFAAKNGGLVRYDAYELKLYVHSELDDTSISDKKIWDLFIDQTGTLWAGTTTGGLNRYNRETDDFTRFQHGPDDPTTLPSNDFKSMYQTDDGTLWVGTTNGFSRFEPDTGTFFTYRNDPEDPQSISNSDVRHIYGDPETGLLWLATRRGGLSVFDPTTETFTNYLHDPDDPTSISNNAVNFVYKDQAGNIWLGTRNGLNRFDPETETFILYTHNPDDSTTLGNNTVAIMLEDSRGRFWIGNDSGLDLFDRQTGTFTHYQHDSGDPNTIGVGPIRVIYEDRTGGLWIGTRGGGVSFAGGEPEKFTTYRNNPNDPHSLSHNIVQALHIDQHGGVWIGAQKGLNYFNGQTFTRYFHDPDNLNSLSHNTVHSIAEDAQGNLWIGTVAGSFDYFDVQTETFTHYQHNPENPDVTNVGFIPLLMVDKNNTLWLSAQGYGLEHFDGETFTIYLRDETPPDSPGIPELYVTDLVENQQDGWIWITGPSGLWRMNPDTETFTSYPLNPPGWASKILQTQDGLLWVAGDKGLYRFDPATETFTHHYTAEDGPHFFGILEDDAGLLWLLTPSNGLYRFNPDTETFRNYDVLDGLQSNEFKGGAIAQAPDGQIFVGGTNGLSAFYPDQLIDNPNIPPVVLTDFALFDSPVKIGGEDRLLPQAINLTDELVLNYDQSVFSFEFTALNYTMPQKNQFAFMMEGFDDEWRITTPDRRYVTYTNLDPGDYTFRVKASNNDGVWNEEGVSLEITITPPWWQTWWFRGLAGVLIVGAIAGAFVGQRQSGIRRERQLEHQVEERTTELQASQRKYRAVVEDQTDLIVRFLPDTTRTFVNQQYCLHHGRSYEDLVGSRIKDELSPQDQEMLADKLSQLSIDMPTSTTENRVTRI